MWKELYAAADFLVNLTKVSKQNEEIAEVFKAKLMLRWMIKFRNHWYPENPMRGNAHRCVRNNLYFMDNDIVEAANSCGISKADLKNWLPCELTIWIDPREVSYRIGEDEGSHCVVDISASECRRLLMSETCKDSSRILEFFNLDVIDFGNQLAV